MYSKDSFTVELTEQVKKLGLYPGKENIDHFVDYITNSFDINDKLVIKYYDVPQSKSNGCYIDYKKEIRLYGRVSLITFLHEIRHYIQFNTPMKTFFKTYDEREVEARGWSSSLFYSVFEEDYLRLSNEGKIKFI